MATRFSIEAVFKAVDKMSNPLRGMNKNTSKFSRALRTDFAKAQRSVDRFSKSVKQKLGMALKRTLQGGLIAVGVGLGIATREFIEFDQTITGAAARFKDLVIGTKGAAAGMEALKKTARDVAKVTQFTATEAAAGLNFFAKAGFTSVEAMAALKTQIDLATVAELDLARTSDITSDLLSSLGLNAQDSATKIANLANLSNSLGIASNMANVTLEDMFETIKVAGPIATKAGEGMNQLIAITAGLGGAGIKGTMAATALKNAYTRLAAPTDKVTAALKELGLKQKDFIDDQGNMKSMVNIMSQLGEASKDMGGAKQLGLFADIFGKQAVAGATNMAESLAEIDLIFRALEGDKKIAEIADEIRKGLGMQIKILKSGLIELGFQFVEAFSKQGGNALENLIKSVQNFDMQKVVDVVKKAVDIFQKWLPILEFMAPIILGIAGAWKTYEGVMFLAATAQTALNIAMNANPVSLIVIAIGILIGQIFLLVKYWDEVTAAVNKALDNNLITAAIIAFAPFLALPILIIKAWEPVMNFFIWLWDIIKPIIDAVGGFFAGGGATGPTMADFEAQGRARVQSPISSAERASFSREESVVRAELLVKDPNNRTEMTSNPSNNNFQFQLSQSGGL